MRPSVLLLLPLLPLLGQLVSVPSPSLLVSASSAKAANRSNEKLLIQKLINGYREHGLLGRPVSNYKEQVEIKFGLAFVQILDLDENRQLLRTNCWLRYMWHDRLLNWSGWTDTTRQFENLTQIRVFPDLIWTPDIRLLNFADERLSEQREARIVVYSHGLVLWVPQSLFKSTCPVESLYFPFDTQLCVLEFGSWTYDVTQLNINWYDYEITYDNDTQGSEPNPYIDYTNYIPSNEWVTDGELEPTIWPSRRTKQIRSIVRCRNVTFQSSSGGQYNRTYKTLQYRVRMRRSASFYLSILVLPCILLSCLTWVIFWLPPESPAKMQLGMNIFVAFFVLMLLLSEATPSAVKTFPLIGYYYCLNMVMITLSTFLAVIVINLYVRAERHAPLHPLLRQLLVEGLGRLFLVRQNVPLPPPASELVRTRMASKSPPPPAPPSSVAPAGASEAEQISRLHQRRRLQQQKKKLRQPGDDYNDDDEEEASRSGSIEKGVLELKRHLRMYLSRLKEKERRNSAAMEWRTLAIVLDRIFFTSYVLAIMVAVVLLIPRAHPDLPYEKEDQKYCM